MFVNPGANLLLRSFLLLHDESCQYLANELGFSLATNSVCICDDDNDVEMALACSHSYIPTLTSESMVDTLRKNKSDFTLTFGADIHSTAATEAALNSIYKTT